VTMFITQIWVALKKVWEPLADRLLLTIGFSIARCERALSKLKLITCLRSSLKGNV